MTGYYKVRSRITDVEIVLTMSVAELETFRNVLREHWQHSHAYTMVDNALKYARENVLAHKGEM